MAVDTAQKRVEQALREMIAEAYGTGSPAVYFCECGHPDDCHEGEEWEGGCAVGGCDCQERVDAD